MTIHTKTPFTAEEKVKDAVKVKTDDQQEKELDDDGTRKAETDEL